MEFLFAKRNEAGTRQGLSGEALLQYIGTNGPLPEDPAISETDLLSYSVKSFFGFLSLPSQDIQFYEEQACVFSDHHDMSYTTFLLTVLNKRVEHDFGKLRRQKENEKRRRESIRRIQQPPVNVYKKVIDLGVTLRSGDPKDPKEVKEAKEVKELKAPREAKTSKEGREPRRRQQKRTSSRGATIVNHGNDGEVGGSDQGEIQVLSCERFWKLVDSLYFRPLPRLSEIIKPRIPNGVMRLENAAAKPSRELFCWREAEPVGGKRRKVVK